MWAQQENINGMCDITVPAHSKEMFSYIMGHQQVISHRSLSFVEVYPCFIKRRHAAAVLVRLIKHRYYSGPAFIDPRAGSVDNLTST